jgi:hypothetical protein
MCSCRLRAPSRLRWTTSSTRPRMPGAVASADQLPNRKREQDCFGPRQRRRSGRRGWIAYRSS